MFSSVKVPRNLCEYRLFRGAADFGNLQQWDLYEKGYSFLTVVTVPKFIRYLAAGVEGSNGISSLAARLLNNFVYILEHEFKGLTGLSDITAETNDIGDGISSIAMINKVTEDTSITISMSFFEKSGRTLSKFCEMYLRGIKDTRTQGKTYWGLIEAGSLEAGFQNEVFSLLYYVTVSTYRHLEGAFLFMCAQITKVPIAEIFESEKGSYSYPEIAIEFNCFPVTDDSINTEAALMLDFLLSDEAGRDQLVVNTQTMPNFYSGEKDIPYAYGIKNAGSNSTSGDYTSGTKDNSSTTTGAKALSNHTTLSSDAAKAYTI